MIDALVIGGGFYGVAIACYLVRQRGLDRVRLVEREAGLLTRASFHNQARIHNGYHYPRSYVTAYRSRINFPRFVADFPSAIRSDFVKLYAVARRNSKVNAQQFARFCSEIGAPLTPAPGEYSKLFDANLIEAVFLTQEYAFDAADLKSWAKHELSACAVEVTTGCEVRACHPTGDGTTVEINATDGEGSDSEAVTARYVFNCTYSGLNRLGGAFTPVDTRLKHEITEMGLVEMPSVLRGLSITVLDGPFFSAMPFPARGLHSLSHVRYTPHLYWQDEAGEDPYARLDRYAKEPRVDRMIRDAARYVPSLAEATVRDSLFEVKTVLAKNERDDGQPILLEKSKTLPGFYSILGGKMDNVYDIMGFLDDEIIQ